MCEDTSVVMSEINRNISKCALIVLIDDNGEILGGLSKTISGFKPLKKCPELFKGNKVLEGLASVAMVKVSSSPGHWCIKAGRNSWCPN